jgi:hypothetical protein
MLILVTLIIITALSLIGYGRLLIWTLNLFKIFPNSSFSTSDYSLLGIFVVMTLAIVGNFFIPLSNFSGVITLILGVLILILFNKKSNLSFILFIKQNSTSFLIMTLCVVLVMARLETSQIMTYQTYKTVYHFDTGLYHMPFLQWIASYPIPIGLANLHGRFGFNSSWLIFHSAWRFPWIGWSSLPMVEGWIWTLGLWILGEGLVNSWTKFAHGNRILLITLALMFFINFGINPPGSVVSTDHAANIVALLVVVYFLEFLNAIKEQNASKIQRGILLMIISSCLAITGKLSMLPIICFPMIGCLMMSKTLTMWRFLIVSLTVGVIFFVLWILRNFLLSGCLVYPVAFTCSDLVSWGVGSQQAIIEKNDVTAWARSPGTDYLKSLDNYNWLTSWFIRLLDNPTIKLVFISLSLSLFLPIFEILKIQYYQEDKERIAKSTDFALIVLIAVLGLLLWFFNGPDPRFSWSFLILASVPTTSFWLTLFNITKAFDLLTKVFQQKVTYYILIIVIMIVFTQYSSKLFDLTPWDKAPNVDFSQKVLPKNGQIIYTPLQNNESLEIYQCWAIPIPCTPYSNDKLSFKKQWGYIIISKNL